MKKKPIVETAELFVGAYLGGMRTKAGIPLEQAAKDTRIRVQRLREIESDDFSGFVHPTYVRLFLLDYANYLGVPLEEIQPMLPDRVVMATGGFEYLNVLGTKENKKQKNDTNRPRHRLLVFLTVLAVIIIAMVIGLFILLQWRRIEGVALSKPISKEVPEQQAKPTPPPAATGKEASAVPAAEAPAVPATGMEMSEGEGVFDIGTFEPVVQEPAPPVAEAVPVEQPVPPDPTPTPSAKPSRRHPR